MSKFQSRPAFFHMRQRWNSYLKAFQYKVLNAILFTNKKLCKIGYIKYDKCSLCKTDLETLCRHTKQFQTGETISILLLHIDKRIRLSDLARRILYTNCPVLIATRYLWGCRRKQTLPCITAFSSKVKIKYMKQKSLYVLKQIKWINLIDGLTLAMKIYSS